MDAEKCQHVYATTLFNESIVKRFFRQKSTGIYDATVFGWFRLQRDPRSRACGRQVGPRFLMVSVGF